jgi:predicted FMN-binding regulatory protein PaiB
MYVPKQFAFPEEALSELHDLIEEQVFGILVAPGDGSADAGSGLQAVHLPFVLDRAVATARLPATSPGRIRCGRPWRPSARCW